MFNISLSKEHKTIHCSVYYDLSIIMRYHVNGAVVKGGTVLPLQAALTQLKYTVGETDTVTSNHSGYPVTGPGGTKCPVVVRE